MDEDFDSYEPYEDDLRAWEDEQVFQDAMLEREELYADEPDDPPFGIDGTDPDFE